MNQSASKPILVVVLALAHGGCLASSRTVRMPNGESALRIECNYEQRNCEHKARALCKQGFDTVTSGNKSFSDREGNLISKTPEDELSSSVFKGVLYVRCR